MASVLNTEVRKDKDPMFGCTLADNLRLAQNLERPPCAALKGRRESYSTGAFPRLVESKTNVAVLVDEHLSRRLHSVSYACPVCPASLAFSGSFHLCDPVPIVVDESATRSLT
jgi:hypothetical protein